MDFTMIANLLLFSGAIGASFLLDSGTSSSDDRAERDPLYDEDDYSRTDSGTEEDDAVAADRDMLAWFLYGGNDTVSGSGGDDFASLGAGDDQAQMGGGDDIARGGEGDDDIAGGAGNDHLLGDDGNDELDGEFGDDSLWGGAGSDTISGDAGDDAISGFESTAGGAAGMGADGSDHLFGGEGNDGILLGPGDIAEGGAGDDAFSLDTRWNDSGQFRITDFANSDDSIEILYVPHYDETTNLEIPPQLEVHDSADGESAVIMLDGVAIGQVDGAAGLDASRIVLTPDTGTDTDPETDDGAAMGLWPADEPDDLIGSSGDDLLQGGAADEQIAGGDGADVLHGDGGNDTLDGGDGSDTLDGGDGDDTLLVGHGDHAMGGDGSDTFEVQDDWDDDGEITHITDFVHGTDTLEVLYTPAFDSSGAEILPEVTLVPMADSTMVVVDAQPVALLAGNLTVQLSDITLIAA